MDRFVVDTKPVDTVMARRQGAARTLDVVGGGVIGLTCALAAADAGWRVRVFDAGRRECAAWVAGGMLGSLGEGLPGEEALLEMSVASVRRWPDLLRRLDDSTVSAATDSLFVAGSSADAHHLNTLADFVWAHQPGDARLSRVGADAIGDLETGLSSRVHSGYLANGEGAVDNRRLLMALESALVAAGGEVVQARITDLGALDADQVLVAAGWGARELCSVPGFHAAKGEIVRLRRTRWSVPPPTRVVRARWHARNVYLIPRSDGIVVGATQYEPQDSDDRTPEVGGVADLLADATDVFPGLRTYELTEVAAGIRPCTPDGLPLIERIDRRVVAAVGHGRNGILLAPFTSDAVLGLLDSDVVAPVTATAPASASTAGGR